MSAEVVGAARSTPRAITLDIAGVMGFALLTALAAQVKVYMPGNPVPITLQTLAVLLAGLCLRPALGTASMALYLAFGMIGLPVFADWSGGVRVVIGATGGYLVGFLLAPALVSWLSRTHDGRRRAWWMVALGVLAGHGVIFALGVPWLKVAGNYAWPEAIALGLVPFLAGTLIKSAVALFFALAAGPRRAL